MTTRRLGDIDLSDYLRIVRPKQPWRRMRAVAVAGACVLCFGAGYAGPWQGKGTAKLTMNDAINLLEKARAEEWEREDGVVVLQRHVERVMDLLRKAAGTAGKDGEYASASLGILTEKGLACIKDLATVGSHPEAQRKTLERIRNQLPLK